MQATRTSRVLVAGIGNVFLGDDAFGVEVAQRLADRALPDGASVVDYGIRGVHLALDLLDGYEALVLVDAMPLGEPPGTVVVFEPDLSEVLETGDDVAPTIEAHSMDPATVLGMLAGMGGHVGKVVVIGCQPAVIEETMGLSPAVAGAIDQAVDLVLETVAELCPPNEERKA